MPTSTIFVETNFLIALLFPHIDYRASRDARQLLEMNKKNYNIVIPFYSTFEVVGTTRRKKEELNNWLGEPWAFTRNLKRSKMIFVENMDLYDQISAYSETDFEAELNKYLEQLDVIHIDEQVLEIARYEINPLHIFSKGDAMDAYILSSILRKCRELEPNSIKIFMSTNIQEFGKIPNDVLNAYKLAYINNFNFIAGLNEWNGRFTE